VEFGTIYLHAANPGNPPHRIVRHGVRRASVAGRIGGLGDGTQRRPQHLLLPSHLLAYVEGRGQRSEVSGQKPEVIVRFIGVTPRSSDVRSLLGSLCQELRLRWPREGELPTDIKVLEVELQEQFKKATPEQPLILFLDALDQLADTDGGRLLHWIPIGPLPAHVKVVVSCLSDRAKDDAARSPIEDPPAEQRAHRRAASTDEEDQPHVAEGALRLCGQRRQRRSEERQIQAGAEEEKEVSA